MGHSRCGGGRGGRRSGGTATLSKHSQLQSGAGACQCGAGKTVGDVADVHIVHLGRRITQSQFWAINGQAKSKMSSTTSCKHNAKIKNTL